MGLPSEKDIECLAYKLWEEAGQPKGRDKEFHLEAERKLKQESVGLESKTTDDL
jgi:hypothetical protein